MFCSCGSVLLIPEENALAECKICGLQSEFNTEEIVIKKHYNNENITEDIKDKGPIINRKCEMCGENKMTFKSVQLRSTDEGQTIFYKCIKCGFKTTVHS